MIVISGHDTGEAEVEGAELGVLEFLHKPFDLALLVAEVDRALPGARRAGDRS